MKKARWAGFALMMAAAFLGASCAPADPDALNPAFERASHHDNAFAPSERERDNYEGWRNKGYHCPWH